MTTPVVKYMRGLDTWKNASPELKLQFRFEMRGRMYGRNETRDAWFWFLAGWQRSHAVQRDETDDGRA